VQVVAPAQEDVRRLAELRLDRPVVVSLYLDLDPAEFATPPARATAARSLLDDAGRRVRERDALSHQEKVDLRASIERAREYLENTLTANGARGVAVFAAEAV